MGKLTDHITLHKTYTYGLPFWRFIGVVLLCMIFMSCSSVSLRGDQPCGVYHLVKRGETLSVIARAYRVDLQYLAEINNIDNPDRIEADSVIFIPEASQVMDDVMTAAQLQPQTVIPDAGMANPELPKVILKPRALKEEATIDKNKKAVTQPLEIKERGIESVSPAEQKKTVADKESRKPQKDIATGQPDVSKEVAGKSGQIRFDKRRFSWPVKGKVVSRFGFQPNRMYYNGIRIVAGEGTAVQAAADGVVIFSAPLKDYGETIIIQHKEQYATVYTHLGTRAVETGSRVNRGDRIAFLGIGNGRTPPCLDFEIRHRNKARNPLFFLP